MLKNLFLATLLLASSTLQAQDVIFGLRAGPSFSMLGGDGAGLGSKLRIGFHMGGYASFLISESLSFQPGLQFASKGAKPQMPIHSSLYPAVRRHSYLDLPLLLKFQSGESLYLLGGAQPSLLISSALVSGAGKNKTVFRVNDVSEFSKGFDFAGVIGLGMDIGSGMHIQATYEHGFTNISKSIFSAFNRSFKLTFGKSF
jgi:hypothetical protein